jgi:carboxymethylenebutenolidase
VSTPGYVRGRAFGKLFQAMELAYVLAQPEVTLFQKSALHCQPTVAKVQWMRRCENYGRQYMNDVTIETPNGSIRGYLVEPLGTDPAPGVVVIHEALGLTEDIKGFCHRFASNGYLALAPDLFARGSMFRCLMQTFRELNQGKGQSFQDVEAARGHLMQHPRCTGKVGVIGFCMGGGFALLMAPRGQFDVAAVNYGRVPEDAESLLQGACPIVASYGGADPNLAGHAERLERALTHLGVAHDVKEYPEAGHSFMNRQHGVMRLIARVPGFGHHAPAAEDAWERVFAMFDAHLDSG